MSLTPEEQIQYDEITRRIGELMQRTLASGLTATPASELEEAYRRQVLDIFYDKFGDYMGKLGLEMVVEAQLIGTVMNMAWRYRAKDKPRHEEPVLAPYYSVSYLGQYSGMDLYAALLAGESPDPDNIKSHFVLVGSGDLIKTAVITEKTHVWMQEAYYRAERLGLIYAQPINRVHGTWTID